MSELTKNTGESDSIAAQSSLPTGTPDSGIRCRAMVMPKGAPMGASRVPCGAGPHPTLPEHCEKGHFWKSNSKAGVSTKRYLEQRVRDIEMAVDAFLRDDLGWLNPADAPRETRKEVRRAEHYEVLSERFLNESKPERSDKFAERAATIRERLRTDARHRPERGPRAPSNGDEPRGESDVAFVRRRLMEVVANGTDAAVVSAARELREQYDFGPSTTAATDAEAVSRLPLHVIESHILHVQVQLHRLDHPDDTRPAADIAREIVAREQAEREAIAAAIDFEAIRRAEQQASMRRSAELNRKIQDVQRPPVAPTVETQAPQPESRPAADVIEMSRFRPVAGGFRGVSDRAAAYPRAIASCRATLRSSPFAVCSVERRAYIAAPIALVIVISIVPARPFVPSLILRSRPQVARPRSQAEAHETHANLKQSTAGIGSIALRLHPVTGTNDFC